MATRCFQQINREAVGRLLSGDFTSNSRNSGFLRDLHTKSRQQNDHTSVFYNIYTRMTQRLNSLSLLFAKQCNVIAAQRLRRAVQIFCHYQRLGYDKNALRNAVEKIGQSLLRRNKPLYALFGASLFQWDKDGISKDELQEVASDITHLTRSHQESMTTTPQLAENDHLMDGWEKVIDKDHFKLWRKPIPNSYLYQYKVFGTYHDLPARAFFNSQLDTEFRKQWDKLIIKLDVIDRNEATGDEVVQWIMHYPYPMYSREYIYIRNTMIDPERKLMVVVNRSVEHPGVPVQKQYVRVNTYMSNMVIRAHTDFDQNGFDYVLTYYDEPKAAIPSVAYNWMARSGVPDYAEKYHKAAKKLYELETYGESTEGREQVPM